jgi:hypothetical protein
MAVGVAVREGSRVAAGIRVSIDTGVGVVSSIMIRGWYRVGLPITGVSGVSVESARGAAAGILKKNG